MTLPLWLHLTIFNTVSGIYKLAKRFRRLLLHWKQRRRRRYARKYGQRRANQLLPLQPDEYPAYSPPLPHKEMGLGDPEFYAATWPALLKVALGLHPIEADLIEYTGRWRFFKWAMLGLLLDWEVIQVRDITPTVRKNREGVSEST